MSINRSELASFLDNYLDIASYKDYGPNGLQIEGKNDLKTICYAVSATKHSIEEAIRLQADALIVHHGLFWKFHPARVITNEFAKRVCPLIKNEINLLGYHLPLDGHPESGNAAMIAKKLNITQWESFGDYYGRPTGVHFEFDQEISIEELKKKLKVILQHELVVAVPDGYSKIKSMGIITGGANSQWVEAQKLGLDAYLTGEISEHDWHEAIEGGICYFAGGHNATEQFGVQALMQRVGEKFTDAQLQQHFISSENPV